MYAEHGATNKNVALRVYFLRGDFIYVNNAVLSNGQSNEWMKAQESGGMRRIDKINAVTLAFVFGHFEKMKSNSIRRSFKMEFRPFVFVILDICRTFPLPFIPNSIFRHEIN